VDKLIRKRYEGDEDEMRIIKLHVSRRNLLGVVVLCLFLCLFFPGFQQRAAAKETVKLWIEGIKERNGECIVFVNHDGETGYRPSPEASSAVLEGQECEIKKITSFAESDENMVYDCIVDVSGSMDQERIDAVKAVLLQFAEGKKENDLMRITQMGNERISSEFISDTEELKNRIGEIAVTREDTNLYNSIKEELGELIQLDSLQGRKCLLIFSDGAEDQSTGITREEAESAVKESGIPVFTVAMLKAQPSPEQLEAAKILGSFARASEYGQHLAPIVDGLENEQIYEMIRQRIDSGLIVSLKPAFWKKPGGVPVLSLTLSDGETEGYAEQSLDDKLVSALFSQGNGETEAADAALEETDAEGETMAESDLLPENEEKFYIWIAAAGILVIIIILLICAKKHKSKYTGSEQELLKKVKITLQKQGEERKLSITLKDEILVGRSRRCQLSVPEDAALSEIHCSLRLKEGSIYLYDENSTNGTYVNGVPIRGEYKLENGDILLLGSAEYLFSWR